MPIISVFYGLIIKMFFAESEHNPPHIHVVYGEMNAVFNIKTGQLMEGDLPPRAMGMVKDWIQLHQKELIDIWETQEFRKVQPLE